MKTVKIGAVVVTGALLLAAATVPVRAASPVTNAFLANLMPNVDFLDRSSRFALTSSKNAHLKDYAHSEAREQTLAANAVDAWIDGSRAPLVATVATTDGQLMTGRSVAVDGTAPAKLADSRLPMGQEDLDSIEGLNGQEFDAQYKEKQAIALNQIRYDYEAYIAKGDDPALIKLATRELPKIKKRIAQLGKI